LRVRWIEKKVKSKRLKAKTEEDCRPHAVGGMRASMATPGKKTQRQKRDLGKIASHSTAYESALLANPTLTQGAVIG
jgi:hypothetical protein